MSNQALFKDEKSISEKIALAVAVAIVMVAVWRDLNVLTRFPVAVGVDGYYYVLQIREILNTGRLYFPTSTPVPLYLMGAISLLVADPVLTVKIAAVLFQASLCAGVFWLLVGLGCSRWLGMAGVLLVAFAGLHFHMIAEFLNNLTGITMMVLCVCCWLLALRVRRLLWFGLAGMFLLLAIFSHKSILPLATILTAFSVLCWVLFTPRRSKLQKAITLSILIGILIAPGIIAAQPFFALPLWLRSELVMMWSPSLRFSC